MTRILIVEDDADINQIFAKIMTKQGYEAVQAFSGSEAALRLFPNGEGKGRADKEFDLIILDLMIPGIPGEEILVRVREESDIPIIVVSARSALDDRVRFINLGADDYLVKPFEVEEVVARVNGALRRYRRNAGSKTGSSGQGRDDMGEQVIVHKNLVLNPEAREAKVCGHLLSLTVHEYDILYLLLQNPGKVYSRESLYEQVWQGGYYGEDNTVNVHVSNLRKKIAVFDEEEYIKTVWGIGFKMA